jgi:hypothetical protein
MMVKRGVEEIGGMIHGLSLNTLLNKEFIEDLEKKFGHITISHIHIDLLDDNGEDVEDVLLLYRSREERKDKTVTLLCDKPSSFKKMVDVVKPTK